MKFYPLFGLFMIFIIWFTYERKKHSRNDEKKAEDFWRIEREANVVRKVNLDALNYISIPLDRLPISAGDTSSDNTDVLEESPDFDKPIDIDPEHITSVSECERIITALSSRRILNLTGMTATDIKFKYGVANLNKLDAYDCNYTLMVRILYRWAMLLVDCGRTDDAVCVLEFGIDCSTDISGHYKLLAELYVKNNEAHKIDGLIEVASSLNSLMKSSIINSLNDIKNTSYLL